MITPPRICLCGFMGAGKSLVGPALASRLHYTFIDLDSEIAAEYEQTIHEIFKTVGEAAFRKSESAHARRLLDRTQLVMALGGGALTDPEVLKAVNDSAYLVYLQASPETLYERVRDEDHRPLLEGLDEYADFLRVFDDRMTLRREGYECARLTVPTDTAGVEDIVSKIMSAVDHE